MNIAQMITDSHQIYSRSFVYGERDLQKLETTHLWLLFFSTNTISATILKSVVADAVQKIVSCGLNPICIVCDLGSNNQMDVRK